MGTWGVMLSLTSLGPTEFGTAVSLLPCVIG